MSTKSSGFSARRQLCFLELPFANKTFFIDIRSSVLKTKVIQRIQALGGQLETFLSKDISLFITDDEKKDISQDAPAKNLVKKGVPLSRGQALLLKASTVNQDGVSSNNSNQRLLNNATKLGLKTQTVSVFLRSSSKHLSKLKAQTKVADDNDAIQGLSPISWQNEKENAVTCYLKVEDQNMLYRPLFKQFDNFPKLSYSGDGSPFDSGVVLHKKNENHENKPKKKTTGVLRGGYCESCDHWYKSTLREHLNSKTHIQFIESLENFQSLNKVTACLPNFSAFVGSYEQQDENALIGTYTGASEPVHLHNVSSDKAECENTTGASEEEKSLSQTAAVTQHSSPQIAAVDTTCAEDSADKGDTEPPNILMQAEFTYQNQNDNISPPKLTCFTNDLTIQVDNNENIRPSDVCEVDNSIGIKRSDNKIEDCRVLVVEQRRSDSESSEINNDKSRSERNRSICRSAIISDRNEMDGIRSELNIVKIISEGSNVHHRLNEINSDRCRNERNSDQPERSSSRIRHDLHSDGSRSERSSDKSVRNSERSSESCRTRSDRINDRRRNEIHSQMSQSRNEPDRSRNDRSRSSVSSVRELSFDDVLSSILNDSQESADDTELIDAEVEKLTNTLPDLSQGKSLTDMENDNGGNCLDELVNGNRGSSLSLGSMNIDKENIRPTSVVGSFVSDSFTPMFITSETTIPVLQSKQSIFSYENHDSSTYPYEWNTTSAGSQATRPVSVAFSSSSASFGDNGVTGALSMLRSQHSSVEMAIDNHHNSNRLSAASGNLCSGRNSAKSSILSSCAQDNLDYHMNSQDTNRLEIPLLTDNHSAASQGFSADSVTNRIEFCDRNSEALDRIFSIGDKSELTVPYQNADNISRRSCSDINECNNELETLAETVYVDNDNQLSTQTPLDFVSPRFLSQRAFSLANPDYSNITEESQQGTCIAGMDLHTVKSLDEGFKLFGTADADSESNTKLGDIDCVLHTPGKELMGNIRDQILGSTANSGSTIRNWLLPNDGMVSPHTESILNTPVHGQTARHTDYCDHIQDAEPDMPAAVEISNSFTNCANLETALEKTDDTTKVAEWLQKQTFDSIATSDNTSVYCDINGGKHSNKSAGQVNVDYSLIESNYGNGEGRNVFDDVFKLEKNTLQVNKAEVYHKSCSEADPHRVPSEPDESCTDSYGSCSTSITDCTLYNFRTNCVNDDVNDTNQHGGPGEFEKDSMLRDTIADTDNSKLHNTVEFDCLSFKSGLSSTLTERGIKISGLLSLKQLENRTSAANTDRPSSASDAGQSKDFALHTSNNSYSVNANSNSLTIDFAMCSQVGKEECTETVEKDTENKSFPICSHVSVNNSSVCVNADSYNISMAQAHQTSEHSLSNSVMQKTIDLSPGQCVVNYPVKPMLQETIDKVQLAEQVPVIKSVGNFNGLSQQAVDAVELLATPNQHKGLLVNKEQPRNSILLEQTNQQLHYYPTTHHLPPSSHNAAIHISQTYPNTQTQGAQKQQQIPANMYVQDFQLSTSGTNSLVQNSYYQVGATSVNSNSVAARQCVSDKCTSSDVLQYTDKMLNNQSRCTENFSTIQLDDIAETTGCNDIYQSNSKTRGNAVKVIKYAAKIKTKSRTKSESLQKQNPTIVYNVQNMHVNSHKLDPTNANCVQALQVNRNSHTQNVKATDQIPSHVECSDAGQNYGQAPHGSSQFSNTEPLSLHSSVEHCMPLRQKPTCTMQQSQFNVSVCNPSLVQSVQLQARHPVLVRSNQQTTIDSRVTMASQQGLLQTNGAVVVLPRHSAHTTLQANQTPKLPINSVTQPRPATRQLPVLAPALVTLPSSSNLIYHSQYLNTFQQSKCGVINPLAHNSQQHNFNSPQFGYQALTNAPSPVGNWISSGTGHLQPSGTQMLQIHGQHGFGFHQQPGQQMSCLSQQQQSQQIAYNAMQTGDMKLTFRKVPSQPSNHGNITNMAQAETQDLRQYWNVKKAGDCRLVFKVGNGAGKRKAEEETPVKLSPWLHKPDRSSAQFQHDQPLAKRRRCLYYK